MAFCSKCGAQLADDAAFCMQCGTPANNQTQNTTQNTAQQAPQSQQYAAPVQPLSPEADIKENKAMAVLSYIGILFLIPLFAAKNSPYARFHVRQGATLFALSLSYTIAQWIIISILNAALPRVYYFFLQRSKPDCIGCFGNFRYMRSGFSGAYDYRYCKCGSGQIQGTARYRQMEFCKQIH